MSNPNPDFANNPLPSGFDSSDSEVIVSDGPGVQAARPPRPLLLRLGLAEQERLVRFGRMVGPVPPGEPPVKLDPENVER